MNLKSELDNETNYTYFGARYYDSDLSSWLSVDPMASARSWVSPYSYCQNNPVGRVDPTGALVDEYIVTVDKNGRETKKRISTLGGNDIDLYHYVGGKLDGKTKIKSNGTGKRKSRHLYR